MNKLRWLVGIPLVVAIAVLGILSDTPQPSDACCPAPPRNAVVEMADQSAIIVWDSENQMEHFIRRAAFKTDVNDFGFLVPSPNKPDLGEIEDAAFSYLAKVTAPEPRPARQHSEGCGIACAAQRGSFDVARGQVELLEQKRVAGLDAAVLAADDTESLGKWLKDHGYTVRPALLEWVKPYVEQKWIVTAFKYVADKDAKEVNTKAVRMSFKTDKPFFPYRVPNDQEKVSEEIQNRRVLRLYFVSNQRMQGQIGSTNDTWPARVAWANSMNEQQLASLKSLLSVPGTQLENLRWITEFEDRGWPRPVEEDLYFSISPDQGVIRRSAEGPTAPRSMAGAWVYSAVFLTLFFTPLVPRFFRGNRRK